MKIFKEVLSYLIIILIVVVIKTFIIAPVKVDGTSMLPTLKHNDVLLLKKYDRSFNRFDIVVVKYKNAKIVKRIIGLPGESLEIKNNKLYINHSYIEDFDPDIKTADFYLEDLGYSVIPDDCYFVMGDNRYNSTDSRIIGVVNKDEIVGVTNFRIFPFSNFGTFK